MTKEEFSNIKLAFERLLDALPPMKKRQRFNDACEVEMALNRLRPTTETSTPAPQQEEK